MAHSKRGNPFKSITAKFKKMRKNVRRRKKRVSQSHKHTVRKTIKKERKQVHHKTQRHKKTSFVEFLRGKRARHAKGYKKRFSALSRKMGDEFADTGALALIGGLGYGALTRGFSSTQITSTGTIVTPKLTITNLTNMQRQLIVDATNSTVTINSASLDWGDGYKQNIGLGSNYGTTTHTYTTVQTFTITATIADAAGDTAFSTINTTTTTGSANPQITANYVSSSDSIQVNGTGFTPSSTALILVAANVSGVSGGQTVNTDSSGNLSYNTGTLGQTSALTLQVRATDITSGLIAPIQSVNVPALTGSYPMTNGAPASYASGYHLKLGDGTTVEMVTLSYTNNVLGAPTLYPMGAGFNKAGWYYFPTNYLQAGAVYIASSAQFTANNPAPG